MFGAPLLHVEILSVTLFSHIRMLVRTHLDGERTSFLRLRNPIVYCTPITFGTRNWEVIRLIRDEVRGLFFFVVR
jgi:hypothetical protein